MPFVQIQTPQSIGASIAIKESRKAAKRKAACALDQEPSPKKSKSLHSSVPPAPAASRAPAPSQIHGHATTLSGPTEEGAILADASAFPAKARTHNATDFSPAGDLAQKRKLDEISVDLVQEDQTHNATDLEPAPKKQKLSNATTPSAKAQKRVSTLRLENHDAPNQNIAGAPPNTAPKVYADASETDLHHTPTQRQMSAERPDHGDENPHLEHVQNTTANASLTSSTSSDRSASASSVRGIANDTAAASSEQKVSCGCGKDHDTAAGSDQIAPLSSNSISRDNSANGTSSPISSVGPPRNRGGRPKGSGVKKPRPAKPLKTPKGPMRFQKNHPVKAAVNVDVWENILSFCAPDFLLKARTISSTFWSVLKDDSPIWEISRVKHFGSDMPAPPSGLSEPQYADLLTGTGCQTRGCTSKKARKTYWAFQRRLCLDCFRQAFVQPKALKKVYKELETSELPEYQSIAAYYQNMEEFLPGMRFDRWDNYQWLGDYDPTPAWGQVYRSGQYIGFPASAYASFSSELANLVGNEYDEKEGRFSSIRPLPGKTCPPQDEIDSWFDVKRVANDALVSKLQAVENWYETYKRNNQKMCKDLRENRDTFYKEQAELAGFDKAALQQYDCYKAAVAISKPPTMQSWNILLPKLKAEREKEKKEKKEALERRRRARDELFYSADERNDHGESA